MPSELDGSTNKGDAANPFVRARLLAQETKRVRELTPEDASSTCAATPPLESLKFMLNRCITGNRLAPADVKVLGLMASVEHIFPALHVALL